MGTFHRFVLGVAVMMVLSTAVSAERWRWPDASAAAAASSVRIDTKVRFVDDGGAEQAQRDKAVYASTTISQTYTNNRNKENDNVAPFREPIDTEGFYNRPPGAGRYPVKAETHSLAYEVDPRRVYPVQFSNQQRPHQYNSDGTLDSFQYCKCLATPECNPHTDSEKACGAGKYLCCYKKPQNTPLQHSEFFNEVDDDRPMLYPSQEASQSVFPPPGSQVEDNDVDHQGVLVGPSGPSGQVGPPNKYRLVRLGSTGLASQQPLLSGPNGPTGLIGPAQGDTNKPRPVLVGPGGPTGVVGPRRGGRRDVLTGPGGPTGHIGPAETNTDRIKGDMGHSESAQRGVLVGPGGPSGVIGPYNSYFQRPVLVGPGGATGVVGPGRGGRRGVLAGPGGPSGLIGPAYGRQGQRGLLVGPGGPSGTIGPGRQLLVGPGGPTGVIGPQRYFGNYNY